MSQLVGIKVEFKTIEMRKSAGKTRKHLEYHHGYIKKIVRDHWAIIEGTNGGLYNRPVNEISVLEPGR